MLKNICIFCGSSPGKSPFYGRLAQRVARTLIKENLSLVYGGASIGLMGILADEMLKNKGRVFGVIPSALFEKEVVHRGLTRIYEVGSMHERKKKMYDLSDAFIALPGGMGTLDELFEILTWTQLGIHRKPCGLLNGNGYYDPLLTFLKKAVREGFIHQRHLKLLIVAKTAPELVRKLKKAEIVF